MGSFGGALIDVFVYAWICNAVVPSFLSLFHASNGSNGAVDFISDHRQSEGAAVDFISDHRQFS